METKLNYIIYKVENHLGEKYIGCTSASLKSRRNSHEYYAANHPTSKLHHSIRKHGADKFEWLVIDSASSKEEALVKEEVYIDHYLSFYSLNGNRGGQGLSGRTHSESTKQKMREAKLNKPLSDQHKKALSNAAVGKHHGELSGMSKLTSSKVREIRRLLEQTSFTQQELADIFNVTASTISSIKTRKTWKHIA